MISRKIESANRQSGTVSNFRVALSSTNYIANQTRWELQQFVMPNSYYNINSSNNIVYFNLNGGGASSAAITPGNYNSTNLAAAVQSTLNTAAGPNWTCTLNATTAVFTITNTQNFTLDFATTTDSAAYILGFANSNTSAALTASGIRQVNLTDVLSIDLRITGLTSIQTSTGVEYAYSIPMNVSSGDVIIWEPTLFRQIASTSSNITVLQVVVIDSRTGNEIPIQLDWYFVIQQVAS